MMLAAHHRETIAIPRKLSATLSFSERVFDISSPRLNRVEQNSYLKDEVRCVRRGAKVGAYQSGLLRFSVNDANMTLKLMLIRSSSLVFASTECRSHDGKTSSVPSFTLTTT